MKDNGIDMDSAVPVVYILLHEGTAPFIDMPLDFIFVYSVSSARGYVASVHYGDGTVHIYTIIFYF